MREDAADHANVVAPPPLIYGGALVVGMLIQHVLPARVVPHSVSRVLGPALIGLGALFGVSALVAMRRAQTSPLPDMPTTALVEAGPFRYTRNPIYVAFTLLYVGVAVLSNALWPLLFLPGVLVAMVRGVIVREEVYLERRFGASYTSYKARVRRWL
jgi:protein-S-isoprenylcysteine O-methyltransferase Ste14